LKQNPLGEAIPELLAASNCPRIPSLKTLGQYTFIWCCTSFTLPLFRWLTTAF